MSIRTSSAAFAYAWVPIWLLAALTAIFLTGLMPLYSTRTLGVAWEMWNSGQFLVPHSNGEPYSHKVPLLFWLIHAGWAIGGVGDVWPRVLEVLTGLGVLLLAHRLARVLWADVARVAALAPWVLAAFSYAFLFSLQIMYEMLLCLCVLGAMNALVGRDPAQRPAFAWFAFAVAAGLMTKGPVMLLHVAFPYLLGPLWHPWAARWRTRWYGLGGAALLAGLVVLVTWALAAGHAGGEVYRNELFFMQTAGRVVDSFDHARPWWWYASMLPVLTLPWILWPRAWHAVVAAARTRRSVGMRFVACWLVPVFVAFSLVSAKQAYYLLPEAVGGAMWLAAGLALLATRRRRALLLSGGGLLAAAAFAGAFALWRLPAWLAQGRIESVWYIDLAAANPWFAGAAALIGVLFLLAPRDDDRATRRIATAAMLAVVLLYALFAQTLWIRFDLRPAAQYIAELEAGNVPVAHYDFYENQFQYLGRLTRPITVVHPHTIDAWALAHPDGRIIHYAEPLTVEDLQHAEFVQPFRSSWLLIERADIWAARRRGETAVLPSKPATLVPDGYWPYQMLRESANR